MKKQLSTLQQLIEVMDPELFRHLGESTAAAVPSRRPSAPRSRLPSVRPSARTQRKPTG